MDGDTVLCELSNWMQPESFRMVTYTSLMSQRYVLSWAFELMTTFSTHSEAAAQCHT
jgi:hypothetical protein